MPVHLRKFYLKMLSDSKNNEAKRQDEYKKETEKHAPGKIKAGPR